MRTIFFLLLLSVPAAVNAQFLTGFGQPSQVPEVLGPNRISTAQSERDFAISPDGREVFYTLQSPWGVFQTMLYIRKDDKGKWTDPVIAPFAGQYSDLEPAFSPDGTTLYFASNRPLSGSEVKDFDIWFVQKEKGIWGKPRNIGTPVNTTGDEFYPCPTLSGNLYFTAAYANSTGKEDIYVTKWAQGKYSDPEPLDTAVNSATYEFNAFVSPAEDLILFTSYGRKDDKGRGDLYISLKDAAGKWTRAQNLAMINSNRIDYCPYVSPDGKILFFSSERSALKNAYTDKPADLRSLLTSYTSPQNGSGDIYWMRFDTILDSLRK